MAVPVLPAASLSAEGRRGGGVWRTEVRRGRVATGKRICMAAPPRRKSLKLRLELREGELDSGKGEAEGVGWIVEDAGDERGRGWKRCRRRVIIRPLGVAG